MRRNFLGAIEERYKTYCERLASFAKNINTWEDVGAFLSDSDAMAETHSATILIRLAHRLGWKESVHAIIIFLLKKNNRCISWAFLL
jgi:hypothetical protein